MSTIRIGGNSGVAVTINKGADAKAQPQRALSFKIRSAKT
jgi:hypothetical protein